MCSFPLENIDPRIFRIARDAEEKAQFYFPALEKIRRANFQKVLSGFQRAGVSESLLKGSSGYGLGDSGREALEEAFAFALDAQDSLVRLQFVSGTHAISTALFSHLRPGDSLVSLFGKPYDSLLPTFHSLEGLGVKVFLNEEGEDPLSFARKFPQARVFYLQRSIGYGRGNKSPGTDFLDLISLLKGEFPSSLIIVDNCYGEFVREREPTFFGADLICGSLIKNPGGGLAIGGGYIAGTSQAMKGVFERFFAPGLGKELGATEGQLRNLFQGLFFAPFTVCEALKGAIFFSYFFKELGFKVKPEPEEPREDIVQAIFLETKDRLLAFARGIQRAGFLDYQAIPLPQKLPGYDEEVIMAGGTFVSGASLELSFDAPVVPPYIGYVQGGLTFDHAFIGALNAAQEMLKKGLLP
ncbi:MAG: methionine gamma-lyase family protein [Caldiserica bacterium]|nr:methionine gamma-lyase family protein [Caldisericota bacterium]MDH7562866.1 methionine gamma-lyase family protein [Caldisericota bacterium]